MAPHTLLLASINARWTHASPVPFLLRNALEAHDPSLGPRLHLRQWRINQPVLDLVDETLDRGPGVILLSVYIWNAPLVHQYLDCILPLLPETRVILGGPEAAWHAEAWLARHPGLEGVVRGPGEPAMAVLASRDFRFPPGEAILGPLPWDFTASPPPYRREDRGELEGRYLYYESSRGCPYACAYCLSAREDEPLRQKSPDQVRRELELILEARPFLVKFVDRTFNAHPRRARELWSWLAERQEARWRHGGPEGLETRYHFEIHPDLLGPEDLDLLARVPRDLFQFEVGVQSIHPATLRRVNRRMDWDRSRRNLEALQALDRVPLHLDMIAGLPGDDRDAVAATLDALYALRPRDLQLGFLKILPGAPMETSPEASGILAQPFPPYEVLQTPGLSAPELAELRRLARLLDGLLQAEVRGVFEEARRRHQGGGPALYPAISDLLAHAMVEGFDLTIRNPEKLKALVRRWVVGFSGSAGEPGPRRRPHSPGHPRLGRRR